VNSWKVIFATLVIFGAGVVTGGLIAKRSPGLLAAQPQSNPAPRPDNAARGTNRSFAMPPMPLMRKDFLKDLGRELELTHEQYERIEKILCKGQECTKQLWDEVAPKMHSEWKCVKEAIRAELTEEQKQKFNEFMKRSRKQEQPPKPEPPQTPPTEAPPSSP
jgi:Spy/CpxP family protein refolding chaperone